MLQQMENNSVASSRRRLLAFGGGLLSIGVAVLGISLMVRPVAAQSEKNASEENQDAIRKALESLKNGPEPAKEDVPPAVLNPVDQMRQAEDALKKARKDVQDNPKSEEARKALEEATKRFQESLKKRQPNFQPFPIAPINPEDLDKELERFNKDVEQMMQDMQRQMQLIPVQPGFFPGNRLMLGGNRRAAMGEYRLGVRLEKPTPTLIDQLDLPFDTGMVVNAVVPESPAAKAGIRPNDIILEVGGKVMPSDAMDMQKLIRDIKTDEKVDIVVMRKGKKETLKGIQLPAARQEIIQPNVPRIQFPRIPQAFPPEAFGGGGGRLSAMSISVTNGEFTIRCSEDATHYTIIGHKDDGGPQVTSIEVNDNGVTTKAESLDKLDAKYRPSVEKMLKSIR